MAVLEAFVYDPLLNWRLLDVDKKGNEATTTTAAGANGGSLSNSPEQEPLLQGNPMAKSKTYEAQQMHTAGINFADVTSTKASMVIQRVDRKLTGTDFQTKDGVTEQQQVELLIQQATNNENLCQCYIGWCPFW